MFRIKMSIHYERWHPETNVWYIATEERTVTAVSVGACMEHAKEMYFDGFAGDVMMVEYEITGVEGIVKSGKLGTV